MLRNLRSYENNGNYVNNGSFVHQFDYFLLFLLALSILPLFLNKKLYG